MDGLMGKTSILCLLLYLLCTVGRKLGTDILATCFVRYLFLAIFIGVKTFRGNNCHPQFTAGSDTFFLLKFTSVHHC